MLIFIFLQVYTLQFDRGWEDNAELVEALYAKLDSARRHRCVVCAPPEAIKSLMLKFVEHVHSIERLDVSQLRPSSSTRSNREIMKTRDAMASRSDMADSLVKV
tara:strand:+ start:1015 stop:1326 length:312 start_codon:yes stop_codon:yes gene_type:complete